MEKSRLKNTQRNNLENFNLNREMEIIYDKNPKKLDIVNSQFLNDRDMFNKFSNGNEIIDYTEIKHDETTIGMPIHNGQILNNKKSLISSPFILENNNKDSFVSFNTSLDSNDMYEEIDFSLESGFNKNQFKKQPNNFSDDILNSMAYNARPSTRSEYNNLLDEKANSSSSSDYICKIEKDIADFEFDINKNKSRDFVVDINSPFALGYLWKSLILLTKNPTTDKLLKLLNISYKESLVTDMKYNADVFADSGKLELILPIGNQTINSNFISKISNIYHIDIKTVDIDDYDNFEPIAKINLSWLFKIEIPQSYEPNIISDFLQGWTKNKIKFIQMKRVPVHLTINRQENWVILEILCGSNMILGFVYSTTRQHVSILPYNQMLQNKIPNTIVGNLIIPKINRNKKSPYGKKFKEELSNMHFGELVYGFMYGLNIDVHMGLEIIPCQESPKIKLDIKSNIDIINVNHKCYYYIKNRNIPNKILSNGLINYN